MTLSKQALSLESLQLLSPYQVRLALLPLCARFISTSLPQSAGDYTIATPDITFTDGNTIKCVDVIVVDDMIVEGTETVRLEMSTTNGQAVVTDTSILSIMDNDGMLQLQLITLVTFVAMYGS